MNSVREYTEEDALRDLYRANPGLRELVEEYERLKHLKAVKKHNRGVRLSNRIKLGIKIFLFGVIPGILSIAPWVSTEQRYGGGVSWSAFGLGHPWGTTFVILGVIINISAGVILAGLFMVWLFEKKKEVSEDE